MPEYKIIEKSDLFALKDAVERLLAIGFTLAGGIAIHGSGRTKRYYQALYRL